MNEVRATCLEKLKKFENHENIENIEKGILNATIIFCRKNEIDVSWDSEMFRAAYELKTQYILINLKRKDRKQFEFPHEICFTDVFELYPEKFKKYKKNYENESEKKEMSGIFECPVCNSNNTTYYQQQTRSSDEAATIFLTCFDCGRKSRLDD